LVKIQNCTRNCKRLYNVSQTPALYNLEVGNLIQGTF
jgi:hypothetical protein